MISYCALIREMYDQSVWIFTIISISHAANVKFLPSTSFNLPINFKDGKLPCSKETVVFPETLLGSIRLDKGASISGLILPRDADIYLTDVSIEFGPDERDVNCTHEGNVYYLEKAVAAWWQPDVWSSPRFNDATPDAEKVPCFDDIVEFPSDAQFTLSLPDKTQFVSGIRIGSSSFTTETFKSRVFIESDQPQQFILNSFSDTGIKVRRRQCQSRAGCSCQPYPLDINCEAKFCSVPTCENPIKPVGHCCKICGGVISFNVDESFDVMNFKELVDKSVESYGINDLVYHIGRLPRNKIQLVVIDKTEYSGTSAEVVNYIDHRMERNWVQGAKYSEISGSPLYKSGLGGKIFVSMFFLVVFVLGGIYVYYYRLPEIPVTFPILHRNAPGVFSRFQTRTDSVVCLTRRDSGVPLGRSAGTAFRNPLYDSKREKVEVEEIADE